MEIGQLVVMVTVAREKSFSRAAQVLGRTQPAVSQTIRRLEEELGTAVFDRSSKDGTLTAAGEVMIGYARQILNLRLNALAAVKDLRDVRSGKITLSANEHTVFAILPIVDRFHSLHPEVKIEVKRGVASRIPDEIASREVELGVLSFRPKDAALVSVSIGSDDIVLIVSTGHRFASKKEVPIGELGSEQFIAHNARSPYRKHVIETFENNDTKLNIAIELPSLEAIKRLVEAGCGIALVPRLSVVSEIEKGTLIGVDVRELKLTRKLNIVYRKNAALSHAAKAFIALARGR
jgi:DNA-binding transcriptional LysR family regulator